MLAVLFRGRLRWALIFWMFLVVAISYVLRIAISITGPEVQKDFGISNVQLGYVFSAFMIGYALFQAPGGRLADRFGPRWVIDRPQRLPVDSRLGASAIGSE